MVSPPAFDLLFILFWDVRASCTFTCILIHLSSLLHTYTSIYQIPWRHSLAAVVISVALFFPYVPSLFHLSLPEDFSMHSPTHI